MASDWQRLSLARTEQELAGRILSDWAPQVGAGRGGVYFWHGSSGGEIHTRGAPDALLDDYEAFGRSDDPLLARVERYHTVAIGRIASLRARARGYAEFAGRHCSAFERYAILPLVANGEIEGTICLSLHAAATKTAELKRGRILQGLSIHASTRLSQLRMRRGAALRWDGALAPDDVLLCDLATGGHTVAAMAAALGISTNTVKKRLKRLYARLDVASRSELAMQFIVGPEAATPRQTLKQIGAWALASRA